MRSFQEGNYCFHTPVVSLNFQRNIHLMILNSSLCNLQIEINIGFENKNDPSEGGSKNFERAK